MLTSILKSADGDAGSSSSVPSSGEDEDLDETKKWRHYADSKDLLKARKESVRAMLVGEIGTNRGLHQLGLLPSQVSQSKNLVWLTFH